MVFPDFASVAAPFFFSSVISWPCGFFDPWTQVQFSFFFFLFSPRQLALFFSDFCE